MDHPDLNVSNFMENSISLIKELLTYAALKSSLWRI